MRVSKNVMMAAALALAGVCALNAAPAQARAGVAIYATSEPPPPRAERVSPPRRGYVWVPGAWAWSHHKYVWTRGHWVRERRGYRYTPARWEREGDRWHYFPGRWDH